MTYYNLTPRQSIDAESWHYTWVRISVASWILSCYYDITSWQHNNNHKYSFVLQEILSLWIDISTDRGKHYRINLKCFVVMDWCSMNVNKSNAGARICFIFQALFFYRFLVSRADSPLHDFPNKFRCYLPIDIVNLSDYIDFFYYTDYIDQCIVCSS